MSSITIFAPDLPESVSAGVLVAWYKQPGEAVKRDEVIAEIETDKVILEVSASVDGVLTEILVRAGKSVAAKQPLGLLTAQTATKDSVTISLAESEMLVSTSSAAMAGSASTSSSSSAQSTAETIASTTSAIQKSAIKPAQFSDEIRHHDTLSSEQWLSPSQRRCGHQQVPQNTAILPSNSTSIKQNASAQTDLSSQSILNVDVESSKSKVIHKSMTPLRKCIAQRLRQVQAQSAMLTTFNEVNMAPIKALRAKYEMTFKEKHGVRLGYMSFFVKAVVSALQRYPQINAIVKGERISQYTSCDISIAIATEAGVVTPVLHGAEQRSIANIERGITDFAAKARKRKLSLAELTGGTFTITNGGVFGSLMSTPILNSPQIAILGMHSIVDRPMAIAGEVKIVPMMYLALTYDHCWIDGKEAVSFLMAIKTILEDPIRLLIDV